MIARKKLPVPQILTEAFAYPWLRRDAFAKALAVPAAAIVAIQVGWYSAGELPPGVGWAAWAANGILWILFAIACHRLVLLGLRPADVARVPGWGRRETFFLAWMILITAIILAIVWVLLIVIGTVIGSISKVLFEATFMDIGKVIGTYLFARLALVLPATAIDARTTLTQAWRQTRGNGWRMVLIVGVLPWVFSYAAWFITGDEPGIARAVLVTALATAFLAVEVSALSLAYRELSKDAASPG